MKIFLTGGTGFIGKTLIGLFAEQGHDVLVLTRSSQFSKDCNSNRLSYCIGDLRDSFAVYSAMKDFGPEALVHLAWEGLPDYSLEMSRQNLECSINVFSAAARTGCSCILSTGTCWEYAGKKGMLAENDNLERTKIFPAAKNALRFIGEAIARENGLRFYWLRLFFVYGPGQRSTSLIPNIIDSIRAGKMPKIKKPRNRHDFVFVGDVAQAISGVIEQQPENSVYNVGSGSSTAVEECVRITYNTMNKTFDKSIFSGRQHMDAEDFWADISLIHRDIGWKPRYNIRSGIKAAIQTSMRKIT